MKNFKFIIITLLAMACALPVSAGDMWQWEDISSKIPIDRQGWKATAIAHFQDAWYFTNGLPLTEKGRVWKLNKNGSTLEVTTSLKNAGLSQVDDIISGVNSILYVELQGLEKPPKIIAWDGSKITDNSAKLAAYLGENQGIYNLKPQKQGWSMITTGGTAIYFENFDELIPMEKDAGIETILNFADQYKTYALRKVSAPDDKQLIPMAFGSLKDSAVAALSGNLFVEQVGTYAFLNNQVITAEWSNKVGPLAELHFFASNDFDILLAGATEQNGKTNRLVRINAMGEVEDYSGKLEMIPNFEWRKAIAAWNGSQWMIISGQNLLRTNGMQFEDLGMTRDLFTDIESDADGTIFLVGSTMDKTMMAKLVRVTQQGITMQELEQAAQQGDSDIEESNEPMPITYETTFLTSLKPRYLTEGKRLITSDMPGAYGVTANDENKLSKVEILVNNEIKATCSEQGFKQIYCRVDLKTIDYAGHDKLEVKARATDIENNTMDSETEIFWLQ